jgi:uncharacterized membrane protein YfhO
VIRVVAKKTTQAEEICKGVNKSIRSQAITLANAVIAMQEKIEQQIPIYQQMPLAQTVQVGTGQKILRNNPATQEFRATVKDYAQALDNLQNILEENKTPATISSLENMRKGIRAIS